MLSVADGEVVCPEVHGEGVSPADDASAVVDQVFSFRLLRRLNIWLKLNFFRELEVFGIVQGLFYGKT